MSVGAICARTVQVAAPHETVRTVAERMARTGVGTVVVLDPDRRPVGVLTDRDIAVRCVAEKREPDTTAVRDVMSAPVASIHESTPIETALARMTGVRTRRLAIVDDEERLVGILALDDVLELLAEEAATIGKLLGQKARAR